MIEEQIHLLHIGWRNFFSSICAVVSVLWFRRKIVFGVTYVLRVQYSCGFVSVFWFWWEIVSCVTYVLRVQYSCAVVSVFCLWLIKAAMVSTCIHPQSHFDYCTQFLRKSLLKSMKHSSDCSCNQVKMQTPAITL
jgi:hypothetical protein